VLLKVFGRLKKVPTKEVFDGRQRESLEAWSSSVNFSLHPSHSVRSQASSGSWTMSSLLQPLVPLPTDGLVTDTSEEQEKTEAVIRELLSLYIAQPGKPADSAALRIEDLKLDRAAHIRWLTYLFNPLPAPYTSLDASRPWLLYWVTHSLALMNAQLDAELKSRAVETIKSFWNPVDGAFGGGPGQMGHLAPTYASISALCYLGGPEDAWSWIDR
jgi:protein farnesyltransferase subunit beta